MKKISPIILVIAGMAVIAMLVAFKTDAPTKEYAIITNGMSGFIMTKPDLTKVTFPPKRGDFAGGQTEMFNSLANEGWELKTVIVTGTSDYTYYMERVKR
jgi:hypothetical protein